MTLINTPLPKGVTYRQLDYWARLGFLHPNNDGHGSGCSRQWPDRELKIAALIGRLRAAGFDLKTAARVALTVIDAANSPVPIADGITVTIQTGKS